MQLSGPDLWPKGDWPETENLRRLPQCQYNHMRDVHITGFTGGKGPLEFLLHIVENAPALEVLTIDTAEVVRRDTSEDAVHRGLMYPLRIVLSDYIGRKVSPRVNLSIL